MLELTGIEASIAHQDAFEALEVAIGILADANDAFSIAEVLAGICNDFIGILTVLLIAEMTIQQHGSTEHRALVVGRCPRVATAYGRRSGIEDHAVVNLTGAGDIEVATLVAIELACLLVVAVVASSGSDIAGSHLSRTVDARIGTVAVATALGPAQQAHIAEIGTLPDAVEVALCIVEVHLLIREVIGTGGSDDEPHHIIVEVVAEPVVAANGRAAVPR